MNVSRLRVVTVLAAILVLGSCVTPNDKLATAGRDIQHISVAGRVMDKHTNFPIAGATVTLAGRSVRTSKQGKFYLIIKNIEKLHPQSWKNNRFVAKFHKQGYADAYDVLAAGQHQRTWFLRKGREITFNPKEDAVLEANPGGAPEKCWTALGRVDWKGIEHLKAALTVDSGGQWIPWPPSEPLLTTLQVHEAPIPCNNNFTVFLPAQSLVDNNGLPPQGDVTATISGINLVNAEEMPGDYGVNTKQGIAQMLSFGAGQIYLSSKGVDYSLKKGRQAKVSIPVDPVLDVTGTKPGKPEQTKERWRTLPKAVPLLTFDETTGFWNPAGTLSYNPVTHRYEGTADHFSVLNADTYKNDPAAVRVDVRAIKGQFNAISLTFNVNGIPVARKFAIEVADQMDDYHLIINLPLYTDVHLQALFEGVGISVAASSAVVVNTGGPEAETFAQLQVYPYVLCDVTAVLWKDNPPTVTPINSTVTTAGPIELVVSYDWASNPTPATNSDRIRLYHSTTSGASGAMIRNVIVLPVAQNAPTTFTLSPASDPSVFTVGQHWFRASAQKGTQASPQSTATLVTVTPNLSSDHDIVINNNTEHTVRELYTRTVGTSTWYPVAGTISPLTTGVNLSVGSGAHDVQTYNGVDPNNYYWNQFDNAEAIAPLNINRPWPDVLTGWSSSRTWRGDGYHGTEYGQWTMTFHSNFNVEFLFDSVTSSFSDSGTGTYCCPNFYGLTWEFTGAGVGMTYFWESTFISMAYPYTAQLFPQ